MPESTTPEATRIRDLTRIITHLDTLYERGDECTHPDTGIPISDGEYDSLRRELKERDPESSIFKTATASRIDSAVKKVIHDPPSARLPRPQITRPSPSPKNSTEISLLRSRKTIFTPVINWMEWPWRSITWTVI